MNLELILWIVSYIVISEIVFVILLIRDDFCWEWYSYKFFSFFASAMFFLLQLGILSKATEGIFMNIFPLQYERLIYEGLIILGLVLLFLINKGNSLLVEEWKYKKNK
jgi:hypothetical protein